MRVGSSPLDESVYGVRDVAGSASEPTTGRADRRTRLYTYGGGSHEATDPRDYHLASRTERVPEENLYFLGIRLVADLAAR